MQERFDELRAMGIRTVITGDNPMTAQAIAEGRVDDFLAEATPRTRWRSSRSRPAGSSWP
jgi:high-affinity K+ transport system ATPase subunit B